MSWWEKLRERLTNARILFFDKLYDRFTDMEKKTFMKSFLEEVNIYEVEQEDVRILRSLKFRFPVFFNDRELYELDWDNESTVESVVLMSRGAVRPVDERFARTGAEA